MSIGSFLSSAFQLYVEVERFTLLHTIRTVLGIFFIAYSARCYVLLYHNQGPLCWFKADFFIKSLRKYSHVPKLDPIVYLFWGVSLMTLSIHVIIISAIGHMASWIGLVYFEYSKLKWVQGEQEYFSSSEENEDSEDIDSVFEPVRQVVQDISTMAKPKIRNLVQTTKRKVANLAALGIQEDSLSRDDIPTNLYSIELEKTEYNIGEKITVKFTACRETMKLLDWIGIYTVSQNFDINLTTSKCDNRWKYVCGTQSPSPNSPSITFYKSGDSFYFGSTKVQITTCDTPGQRQVTGYLEFDKEQLPWQIGMFEFRYHYHGQYIVLAQSAPFAVTIKAKGKSINDQLEPILSSISQNPQMTSFFLQNLIIPRQYHYKKFLKLVCQRIVYCIKHMYGVDISWHVIENIGSIENLSKHIQEAQQMLDMEQK
jgi:phosphatidylethanolamine N-methyltransferase